MKTAWATGSAIALAMGLGAWNTGEARDGVRHWKLMQQASEVGTSKHWVAVGYGTARGGPTGGLVVDEPVRFVYRCLQHIAEAYLEVEPERGIAEGILEVLRELGLMHGHGLVSADGVTTTWTMTVDATGTRLRLADPASLADLLFTATTLRGAYPASATVRPRLRFAIDLHRAAETVASARQRCLDDSAKTHARAPLPLRLAMIRATSSEVDEAWWARADAITKGIAALRPGGLDGSEVVAVEIGLDDSRRRIRSVKVRVSSGDPGFDASVLAAIEELGELDPLPEGSPLAREPRIILWVGHRNGSLPRINRQGRP